MDVRHEDMARSVRQEDVAHPMDGMKPGSGVDVAPALTEPNVIPPGSEKPMPSPIVQTVDAAELPQSLYKL